MSDASEALEHAEHAEEAYQELRKAHTSANEDEKTVEALDPDGKLRAENAAAAESSEHAHEHPAASPTDEEHPKH